MSLRPKNKMQLHKAFSFILYQYLTGIVLVRASMPPDEIHLGNSFDDDHDSCFDVVNDLRRLSRRWWQSAFIGSSASRNCFYYSSSPYFLLLFKLRCPEEQHLKTPYSSCFDVNNDLRNSNEDDGKVLLFD